MSIDERIWRDARAALSDDARPPRLDDVVHRARGLRARRIGFGVIAAVVIAAGLMIPLRALTGLGQRPTRPADAPTDARWITHVEPRDDVSIDAPQHWWFDEDPNPLAADPRELFAVGVGANPSPDLFGCDEDELGRLVPPTAAIVVLDEVFTVGETGAPVDPSTAPSRPQRITLDEMGSTDRDDVCLTPYRVLNFTQGGRYLSLFAYLGAATGEGERRDIEAVMNSLAVGPAAPEPLPTGEVGGRALVASGKAFGKTWSLFVEEQGDEVCFELTNAGGSCSPRPTEDSGHFSTVHTGGDETAGRFFIHGPARSEVFAIRIRLRDGRILQARTFAAPSFGLRFFVIPVQGHPEIDGYDHLDEAGQVIESTETGH